MAIRGPVTSIIPAAQQPIGFVEVDGKRLPVTVDEAYRRHFETQWQRSGEFEDETFDTDAVTSDLIGKLSEANERIEALEAALQQDRSIDAALADLQTRMEAIENLPTIQENADVAGQIAALEFGIKAVEEQVFTAPRGIDVVTDGDVANNAGISPTKLAVINEFTETYTNTTAVSSAWRIMMKKQAGGASKANQFFLDGSRILLNTSASGDDAGTFNWEVRVHDTEPTAAAHRTNGVQIDSGTITVSTGAPTGNVSFWTPTTQFYTWRNSLVTYPTDETWIVIWGFVGTGPATEAYMDQVGLGSRIDFTSAFGFDKL